MLAAYTISPFLAPSREFLPQMKPRGHCDTRRNLFPPTNRATLTAKSTLHMRLARFYRLLQHAASTALRTVLFVSSLLDGSSYTAVISTPVDHHDSANQPPSFAQPIAASFKVCGVSSGVTAVWPGSSGGS